MPGRARSSGAAGTVPGLLGRTDAGGSPWPPVCPGSEWTVIGAGARGSSQRRCLQGGPPLSHLTPWGFQALGFQGEPHQQSSPRQVPPSAWPCRAPSPGNLDTSGKHPWVPEGTGRRLSEAQGSLPLGTVALQGRKCGGAERGPEDPAAMTGAACLSADLRAPNPVLPRSETRARSRAASPSERAPCPLTMQAALTACSKLRQNGSETIACQQLSRFQNFTR